MQTESARAELASVICREGQPHQPSGQGNATCKGTDTASFDVSTMNRALTGQPGNTSQTSEVSVIDEFEMSTRLIGRASQARETHYINQIVTIHVIEFSVRKAGDGHLQRIKREAELARRGFARIIPSCFFDWSEYAVHSQFQHLLVRRLQSLGVFTYSVRKNAKSAMHVPPENRSKLLFRISENTLYDQLTNVHIVTSDKLQRRFDQSTQARSPIGCSSHVSRAGKRDPTLDPCLLLAN